MKHGLLLFIFSVFAILITNKTSAQVVIKNACIKDNNGWLSTFKRLNIDTVKKSYQGVGIATTGNFVWKATIQGSYKKKLPRCRLVYINPLECNIQNLTGVDSIENYHDLGSNYIFKFKHGFLTFSVSGHSASWCHGSVIAGNNSWGAIDCADTLTLLQQQNKTVPVLKPQTAIKIIPNPVVTSATITYSLYTSGNLNITVYNAMMQPVQVLVNDQKTKGSYSLRWNVNSSKINPGIYRVVANINGTITSLPIQIIK